MRGSRSDMFVANLRVVIDTNDTSSQLIENLRYFGISAIPMVGLSDAAAPN